MPRTREVTAADPAVRAFSGLTDVAWRRSQEAASGLYVAEGATVIGRAVGQGHHLRCVLTSPRWLASVVDLLPESAEVLLVEDAVMEQITGFRVHRGALATFERPGQPAVAELVGSARRLVALEGLVDPTNVGLIARSAAALGFDGLVLDPRCGDPLYRRSVKVSMGAVLALPHARADRWPADLGVLRSHGFELIALAPKGTEVLGDVRLQPSDRVCLLVGSEGPGLRASTLALADRSVRIPMSSTVESLNVAAAAAIACAHVAGVIKP